MNPSNQSVFDFLQSLFLRKLWCAVTLKLENGNVVFVRLEETFKPNELPNTGRFHHANVNEQ